MPTKRAIVAAALRHSKKVGVNESGAIERWEEVFLRHIVWAVWKQDRRIKVRIVKGWAHASDPEPTWGAVFAGEASDAFDLQEFYGDGAETLERDHYPAGALTEPVSCKSA